MKGKNNADALDIIAEFSYNITITSWYFRISNNTDNSDNNNHHEDKER
jgi:hypothetical protein